MDDVIQIKGLPTVHAIIAQHRAVQLQDFPASRRLMKPVYVLGDHSLQFPLLLKLCKREMGSVRLCIREQHLVPVKAVKFLCPA